MAYTPELTDRGSATLRRLAWSAGQPMTRTLEKIIDEAVKQSKPGTVCCACKDKSKCSICGFNSSHQPLEK